MTDQERKPRQTVSYYALREAVDAACTCGGAGPGDGCPACEVWHALGADLSGFRDKDEDKVPW